MNTTDTVKAKLTPGEFVIRKEAVDMIGVPMLEKLNGMPEEGGGHSAIDRIIQMATLQNMQPMYSGGEVEPNFSGDMQGMMGGGYMKPQQYEDGGQAMSNLKPVPDNNPGLAKLPEDVRNKMGYMQEGGMAYIDPADSSIVVKSPEQSKMFNEFTTNTNFAPGTSKKYMLETIIDALNNPEYYGLNKKDTLKDNNMIPKSIKAPDSTIDSLIGMMHGGKAKKKKEMYGYQEGGQAFVEPEIRRNNPNLGIDPYMRYEILEGKPMMNEPLYDKSDALVDRLIQGGAEMSDIIPYKERKDFKRYVESGEGNARDEMLLRKLLDAMPKPSRIKRKGEADLANMNFLAKKGYDRMREDILQEENRPMGDLRKAQEGREDILYNILDTSNFFNKEDGGLLSYQDGGEVPGYQDGGQPQQDDAQVQAMMEQQAMMQQQPQPNQFVPFDQRPNQNPATGNWGESGDYMQAIRAEKDSLDMQDKEILRQKALNAFQRIRLDSLAEQGIPSDVGAINSDAMGSYSRPDSASMSIDRNKGQYFQQQVMQRSPYDSTTRSNSYKEGLESVLQGMFQGDNNRGIYR